jgi:hypothetical protein
MAKKYHIVPIENLLPAGVCVYDEATGMATLSNPQPSMIENTTAVVGYEITREFLETTYPDLPVGISVMFTNLTESPFDCKVFTRTQAGFVMYTMSKLNA